MWQTEQPASQRLTRMGRSIAWIGNTIRWMASHAVVLRHTIIAICCCIGLIWVSLSPVLAQGRQDAEIQATSSLALTVAANTDRIVAGIDQMLLSARAAYLEDEKGFDVREWVSKTLKADKYTFFIGRIDEHGISGDSTLGPEAAGINLANQELFRVQLDPTHDDLFISKPVVGRATRMPAVHFTRKLLHPDGKFAGVIDVVLDATELSWSYETTEIGNGYVMLVGTDDRIIRASAPLSGNMIGHTIDDPELLKAIQSEQSGSLSTISPSNGTSRIVSFRRLHDYPLVVVVGSDATATLHN